ncbi:(-)-alpha-terpineol synthase-like [Rhodamnia argentea]|uniref:(-)-alpha-terpineol synthase-like n=1 Tax=Rhodamnia argentea TaxID=178133 RepID=A0ABM3GTZ9_9MYRT|nr:(-)-alpha-terpineol synthase-like [Rhodamnia argentea]
MDIPETVSQKGKEKVVMPGVPKLKKTLTKGIVIEEHVEEDSDTETRGRIDDEDDVIVKDFKRRKGFVKDKSFKSKIFLSQKHLEWYEALKEGGVMPHMGLRTNLYIEDGKHTKRLSTNFAVALRSLFTSFLPSSIGHKPSLLFYTHPRFWSSSSPSSSSFSGRFVICVPKIEDQEIVRRSVNWQPSIWDYDFVQSLSVAHTEDKYTEQVQRLKEEVKGLFDREMNRVAKLEFIDMVQRLGLGYHFQTEIKDALRSIHSKTGDAQLSNDLCAASLRFRLLRQHGYDVPQGRTSRTSIGFLQL